eukprot:1529232-Pyramimonas_sp.AAC.1
MSASARALLSLNSVSGGTSGSETSPVMGAMIMCIAAGAADGAAFPVRPAVDCIRNCICCCSCCCCC